ncbi:protein O-mannosyl-transferase 1-like [Diadema antillarum]|uniref:protein O-mannosyl-transferase 1-like n=1 Tax=Diadema antillarum TaxID=105358 RepID=UPI003A89E655
MAQNTVRTIKANAGQVRQQHATSSSVDGGGTQQRDRSQSEPASTGPCTGSEPDGEPCATAASFSLNVTININVLFMLLTVLSFGSRLWRLEQPRGVVFDETHFGLFTSFYLRGIFFFDVHPPLGKLLLAVMGHASGFEGDFAFDKIGLEYPCDLPIWYLRLLPALCGALLTPLSYLVLEAMGFNQWTAALGAILVLCDNSLLTQSRFILMDTMLLSSNLLAFLALLKFRQLHHRAFTLHWWLWLVSLGVFTTCSVSIKYCGVFTVIVILGIVVFDYWCIVGDRSVSNSHLLKHTLARVMLLVGLPMVLYSCIFYVHLGVLHRSGPHDNRMSSAFQASLQGGLSNITRGQPTEVAFGSQITLRHTHGSVCWLHSHANTYPLRYSESRGSSLQQQVTCYSFKDVNNWWIVKDPRQLSLGVEDPPRPVRHGDIIQLVHGMTGRRLNSHDVAAPMSPQFMEVSCYIDYNISFPAQDLWKVEIVNGDTQGNVWNAIHSHIRLIHVNTSQAIKLTGQQLPDWGFHQLEVATDKMLSQDANIWNVEEHKYSIDSEEETWREAREIGFFSKFWELQWKMLEANKMVVDDHKYRSDPIEWPLMERGIAYWMDSNSNAQIHFLGNAVLWWSANVGIVVYLVVTVIFTLRYQRACSDLSRDEWMRLLLTGALFVAWLLNYLPYFAMDRTLFLHHYLPALLCKILLLASLTEIVYMHVLRSAAQRSIFLSLLAVWLTSVLLTFKAFLPLCYGTRALSEEEIEELRWNEDWGFLVHGKMIS